MRFARRAGVFPFRKGTAMRRILVGLVSVAATVVLAQELRPAMSAPTDPPKAETAATGKPFVVEYYYTARWGHADEFIRLFKKNHWPVLKKQVESGRFLKVTAVKPRYHTTEDGRWDYRVTIVFKDVAAAHQPSSEDAIKKQLFPDQETFKKEEQRRFEILKPTGTCPSRTSTSSSRAILPSNIAGRTHRPAPCQVAPAESPGQPIRRPRAMLVVQNRILLADLHAFRLSARSAGRSRWRSARSVRRGASDSSPGPCTMTLATETSNPTR